MSELADVDLSVVAFLRQLSGRCSLPEPVGKEDIVAPPIQTISLHDVAKCKS